MACYVEVPIEQEVDGVPSTGYNPFNFPVEGGYLPFFFTNETFTRVLSALVNGAMLTYGNEGMQVVWDFLVNVEFPVSFCEQLIECLTTDEDVQQAIADLISTNEAVQGALREFVTGDTEINNYYTTSTQRLTAEQIAGSIMTGDCDNSAVAGQVIQIIDAIDGYNQDGLEIVEVGTNDEERLASFISGFPAFGLLPADEALDTMQDWLEDFSENYLAAVTPEWKNEVAEDLYCIALGLPDCSLTYEALFNYFQDRVGSTLNIFSTVFDVVQFLVDGDFNTDDLVASGMYAAMLGGVLTGRNYFGLTLPGIGAIARDASPSTAWEDWDECGDPPPVEDCYDFQAGQQSFIPYFNGFVEYATYSAGNGFGVGYNPGIIKIRREDMGGTVIRVTGEFSAPVPSGVNNVIAASNYNGTGAVGINDVDTDTFEITGLSLSSGLDVDLTFDGTLPAGFYLKNVCVELATP